MNELGTAHVDTEVERGHRSPIGVAVNQHKRMSHEQSIRIQQTACLAISSAARANVWIVTCRCRSVLPANVDITAEVRDYMDSVAHPHLAEAAERVGAWCAGVGRWQP